jgi:flagellar P-ring protein precursor FlgI
VITGGFVSGSPGNSQSVNFPTVGRVPNGAIIERAAPAVVLTNTIRLQLRQADFTTSARIAEAVNTRFASQGPVVAHAENSALVKIAIPQDYYSRTTEFVAEMEKLTIETDRRARVVVNERTGTIVFGNDVKISPVAIMHGNLTVEIQTTFAVSQPTALSSGGTTEVIPQQKTQTVDEKTRNVVLKQGATVEELIRALTSVGSTARDIIAILENLRNAGALEADLEVI